MAGESPVAALRHLHEQIESRLLANEDYRALKAIERAMPAIGSPAAAKLCSLSLILGSFDHLPSPRAHANARVERT